MTTRNLTTTLVSLIGGVLALTVLLVALPGWVPALAESVSTGTVNWLLARAGGFVAYGLLWLSVVFGLLLTSRIARNWPGMKQAMTLHRAISLLALVYAAGHALVLLGDHTIAFDLPSILVPFATTAYRPFAVGLGQIGLYVLLVVFVSSVLRRRKRAWRALHTATFVLYYLVIAHSLLAGTDSKEPWALAFYIGTGLFTYALTVYRILVAAKPAQKESPHYGAPTVLRHDPAGGR